MLGYTLNEAAEKIVHLFDGSCTVSWGGPDPVTGKIKVASYVCTGFGPLSVTHINPELTMAIMQMA
jgi:hypothetical protein